MNKLVIFDGNAIMHRAYHALPPLTDINNEPINAVYGLVSMLLKVIQDLGPTHIAFAFDRKEPTFRKEILESYQAHRPEMDKNLSQQFEKAARVISAFGIPIYDKAGFEADDIIGTISLLMSSTSKQEPVKTVIVTGDRDMLQLVNDKVHLYMPGRSLSDAQEFDTKKATAKLGVPPSQVVDLKALTGDPSDNYKGVPGIGPKTAIKLLQEYKTLENIYKNLNKVPEKTVNLLQTHKDSALQSQKLAKIVQDVKMNFNLDEAGAWQLDNPKLLKLFKDYGFKTLTKRAKEVNKQIASKSQIQLL